MDGKRTALYRHFDATGVLPYVGISLNAIARLGQHRLTAEWFEKIARIEITWHASREEAEAMERAAIRSEYPLFNSKHNLPLAVALILSSHPLSYMVGEDGELLREHSSLSKADADELADRL